ncbi:MAG: glycosyltransferase family 4 protein [Candidatus Aureabacteria bacterium]|nr:glycosyltransferase family 4 protein [Candidatus Auribacterota bacterium]
MTPKTIAFISPRYIEASAGGAEVACRLFAENLHREKGVSTEILTTCAEDHYTWLNVHKEGNFEKNGVLVRRFSVDTRKETGKFDKIAERLFYKQDITAEEERFFFDNNLNSQGLYEFIKKHADDYAFFIFVPYLFGLTVNGSRLVPEKTLLIPCLHDEPYAKLPLVRKTLSSVKGIICNSLPEAELVRNLGNVPPERTFVVGIGVDPPESVASPDALKRYPLRPPYIFYCGRREHGKSFFLLLEMFREYKKQNASSLQLVSAGSGYIPIAPSEKENIIDVGYVSEPVKARLYREALLTCQPSTKESFSIALMESWHQGRPVVVSRRSSVTEAWVRLSGGGFSFQDFFDFEQILNYSLSHPEVLERMGACGREFAQKNFSSKKIIDRFLKALIHFGYVI